MSQMASIATYAVASLVRDLLTTAMGASTGQRKSTAPATGIIRCGSGIRSVARCTRSTRLSFSRPVDWTLAVGNILLPQTVVCPCIAHRVTIGTAHRPARCVKSRSQKVPLNGGCEIYFVTERNTEITGVRNFWLPQPRPVHRAWPQRRKLEPPALVEPQRRDVVVRRGQRDLVAAAALGLRADRLDEQRADPGELVKRVDRDDLQDPRAHIEGDQPGDAPAALGDEAGQSGGIEDAVVHDHLRGAPELGREPLDGRPVGLLDRPDRYVQIVHRFIIPSHGGAGT